MGRTSLIQCTGRLIQINYLISLPAIAKIRLVQATQPDSLSNKAVSWVWQIIATKENEKKNIPT
jgi:hypothetical protein